MIIAAGRGKLRQISLQGHQGPLAHLYFHSHTPSLCYAHTRAHTHTHTHTHTHKNIEQHTITPETVQKEGMCQERKRQCWCFLKQSQAFFDYLSSYKTTMTFYSLRNVLKILLAVSILQKICFSRAHTATLNCQLQLCKWPSSSPQETLINAIIVIQLVTLWLPLRKIKSNM